MPRVLSLALRPRTLSGMFGQEAFVKTLRAQMKTRQPRSFLFFGTTGCGKTTASWIVAVAFQCDHQTVWGDPCDACWKARKSFDIHEINASETSGVEEMAKIARISRHAPLSGHKRVIIMDEFQRASGAAQNLLLKPTEEPPESTIWIVATTEPSKILPTLRRRFTTYQLKALDYEGRERFLQRAAKHAKFTSPLETLYEQVHMAGIGSPAILLQALEKFAAGSTAVEAISGVDGAGANSLRICKAVTSGDWPGLKKLLGQATPEDSRWIKTSVSGWLRGTLMREADPKMQERAALSISELTAPSPIEDATLAYWLWPVLWKITRRYK